MGHGAWGIGNNITHYQLPISHAPCPLPNYLTMPKSDTDSDPVILPKAGAL
jgi:hypothetical protein